jgi:hypothetical protein
MRHREAQEDIWQTFIRLHSVPGPVPLLVKRSNPTVL